MCISGIELNHRQQRGLTNNNGRFSIDGAGYARARYPPAGVHRSHKASATASPPPPPPPPFSNETTSLDQLAMSEEVAAAGAPLTNVWLGATSMPSRDERRIGGVVAGLQVILMGNHEPSASS